jgi:hypothetical protein
MMNSLKNTLPTLDALKDQARRLRSDLKKSDPTISHSKSLELIAHQYGFKDWNTLHAAVGNRPAAVLTIGQKVKGLYLGQEFDGEVIGLKSLAGGQKFRVNLHLDEPVDVVKFDSFSAFRHRVNCTIDPSGKTVEKTSDDKPQLVLEMLS